MMSGWYWLNDPSRQGWEAVLIQDNQMHRVGHHAPEPLPATLEQQDLRPLAVPGPMAATTLRLREEGMDVEDIAAKLDVLPRYVRGYLKIQGDPLMVGHLAELDVPIHILAALRRGGIEDLDRLTALSWDALIEAVGTSGAGQIRERLAAHDQMPDTWRPGPLRRNQTIRERNFEFFRRALQGESVSAIARTANLSTVSAGRGVSEAIQVLRESLGFPEEAKAAGIRVDYPGSYAILECRKHAAFWLGQLEKQRALAPAPRYATDLLGMADKPIETWLETTLGRKPSEDLRGMRVSVFRLSNRSSTVLSDGNVRLVGDLLNMTSNDLLQVRSCGRKSLNEILEQVLRLAERYR